MAAKPPTLHVACCAPHCDTPPFTLLQEIATYGSVPYPGVDHMLVLDKLEAGKQGRQGGFLLDV